VLVLLWVYRVAARGGSGTISGTAVRLWLVLGVAALVAFLLILVTRAGGDSPVSWLKSALAVQHPWMSGACQTLAPEGQDRHRTVFIDPGHGSPDPGASGVTAAGQPVEEKDLTLATALRLARILRGDGYRVVLARVQDRTVARLTSADLSRGAFTVAGDHKDLVARVACANAAHAQVLVSLHYNAFSDPAVGGVETFYDDARPFSKQNLQVAQLVQRNIITELAAAGWQVPDRGVTPDSSVQAPTLSQIAAAYPHLLELGPAQPGYLDRPSTMPGVLCEPLFLTNPAEASVAASGAGQDAIARGIAQGVEQFLATSDEP
jgi:N-acetylmuramoyl-L-alanine amidase